MEYIPVLGYLIDTFAADDTLTLSLQMTHEGHAEDITM